MTFDFINQIDLLIEKSAVYLKPWLYVLGALWCINILNWISGSKLNYFGIYPRTIRGLFGILFSPFIHGNFSHLLFNTIPLFFLGLALLARDGTISFYWITLVIIIVGGLGVWIVGRSASHIGASGLISGYFGYILVTAYTEHNFMAILFAVLAIYYFGGIFLGLLPGKKESSWESHLCGFLSGILCGYIPNGLLFIINKINY